MSRHQQTLIHDFQSFRTQLDTGVRAKLGVSGAMYRALDRLFNILVLGVTVFLVQSTEVEVTLVMAFAVLLIGGAEYLQSFLLAAGRASSAGSEGTAEE